MWKNEALSVAFLQLPSPRFQDQRTRPSAVKRLASVKAICCPSSGEAMETRRSAVGEESATTMSWEAELELPSESWMVRVTVKVPLRS
ncbi:MAG: hypothetical protein A4E30_00115 [Methanomassiliicoccales archaeon PtaB.Bin215]|nr:MAG: hypothetical protein A4E30_00115 [Methanomassiliicoccales archaeon PtaB.Bin215]